MNAMASVPLMFVPPQTQHARRLRFVFFPLSWVLAHVGRSVEVAKELRELGHEVIFAGADKTHPRSKLYLAERAGFEVISAKEPAFHTTWDRFQKYGPACAVWDSFRSQTWAPIDQICEDMLRIIDEYEPDCIVGDGSVAVSTAAHIAGIPAACIMNGYFTHFAKPGTFFRELFRVWDFAILKHVRARVYKKFGVKQVDAVRLLESITMISPDLPAFEETLHRYPNLRSVGPLIFEPDVPLPAWYDELDDGRPNIYMTMGSTGIFETFLPRVYDELGKLPYRFLVTHGGQLSEQTIAAAPDNFRFANYAPGSAILKHCVAQIFHGGNGSMYQALAAGVPMIALPSHLEQMMCFRMAKKRGFGIQLSARHITGKKLAAAIEDIVHNPGYRREAKRYSEAVRSERGRENAARLLTEVAMAGEAAGTRL